MEIKGGIPGFTLKQKIVFAIIMGSLHAFLLWILFNIIGDDGQTTAGLIFQGVFFGLFMGFGMPLLMKKFPKTFTKSPKKVVPDLEESEVIEVQGPANLFRGIEGVGGVLFITNKKVLFKSHKFNIQTGQTDINFTEIEKIEKRKSGKIFNNGIRITTTTGKKYDLVVNQRHIWMEQFTLRLKSFVTN